MHITIINGPNLNLTGSREPALYGTRSMGDMLQELERAYPEVEFDYFQSNHEGVLIDKLQHIAGKTDGIVLNAGGLSHTSVALADAVAASAAVLIEVHITNIAAREAYRRHSYITAACRGIISGLGLEGYRLAVQYLLAQTPAAR